MYSNPLMLGAYHDCGQTILVVLPELQRALWRQSKSKQDPTGAGIAAAPLASRRGNLILKYFLVGK